MRIGFSSLGAETEVYRKSSKKTLLFIDSIDISQYSLSSNGDMGQNVFTSHSIVFPQSYYMIFTRQIKQLIFNFILGCKKH